MFAIKSAVQLVRGAGWFACIGSLYFAAGTVLQGVAQLQGEGLAKRPETAEEGETRLHLVLSLLAIGFCASLAHQAGKLVSRRWKGDCQASARQAVFEGLLFWTGVCIFFCFLILAGSLQARWEVAGFYYWLAGAAGIMVPILLGAAGFFQPLKASLGIESDADRPSAARLARPTS